MTTRRCFIKHMIIGTLSVCIWENFETDKVKKNNKSTSGKQNSFLHSDDLINYQLTDVFFDII